MCGTPLIQSDKLIPDKIQKLINGSRYAGFVHATFEKFVPILGNNNSGLFFFPEYTDHGPNHIRGVLSAAAALIPKELWDKNLLIPEDGVILVISALLHDLAMVLTSDGLLHLLTTDNLPMLGNLDNRSWKNLFDEFYTQARRWDDKILFRILGDREVKPGAVDLNKDVVHIRERPNPEEWSVRYRKFLGEFVRQHHARISHEIACYGFPSNNASLKFQGISDELADLSGFIARSHNISLRSTYNYLDTKFDGHVICRGTHPIYLMVLLRIADYLQIDSTRVNANWQSIQRLRSPISKAEWDAHLAVNEIRHDDNDPECLFVSAKPANASTYIKIKKVLAGLQNELDTSWAVISEVFGRRGDLRDLEISLRRIRSNLDDNEDFVSKHSPNYFPVHAAFDTAGASLLKLLIRPLYGDRPEIAIRELMQNSLDAVRELRRLREIHPELSDVPLRQQKADILVSIDKETDGHYYLTVSDKGVGMTAETVRDYFLKAGASFRHSDAWQKEFIRNGKSTVLRSGRFGIGALAAFLLGSRIEVATRHAQAKQEDGVAFEAGIDDESIELRRDAITTVGTTIRVRLTREVTRKLSKHAKKNRYWADSHPWDWYVLDDPIVERRLKGRKLKQSLKIPSSIKSDEHPHWRVIHHRDYQGLRWGYFFEGNDLNLACNGIRIMEPSQYWTSNKYSWEMKEIPFELPFVSVLDENAKLPLTLQRGRLETISFPFAKELLDDLTKDFCAYLLIHSPCSARFVSEGASTCLNNRDWNPLHDISRPFIVTQKGTMLLHPWHIKEEETKGVLVTLTDLSKLNCYSTVAKTISGYSEFYAHSTAFETLSNPVRHANCSSAVEYNIYAVTCIL